MKNNQNPTPINPQPSSPEVSKVIDDLQPTIGEADTKTEPVAVGVKPSTDMQDLVHLLIDGSNGLATQVHPCWKLKDYEARILVKTGGYAFPDFSIARYAKPVFFACLAMAIIPRLLITIKEYITIAKGGDKNVENKSEQQSVVPGKKG